MTPVEVSIGGAAYDWWELVPAIIGAIIGALAGGIPAYLLAVRSSKEAASKENELLAAGTRSKATAIFLQFQSILNDSVGTLLLIEDMLADLKLECELEPYRIQRRVRSLANIDFLQYANFSSDDLSILIKSDKMETLQKLILISNLYNASLNSLRTYGRLKKDIYSQLIEGPVHRIESDGKVTSTFKDDQGPKLRLHEAQGESVISPTIYSLRELVDMVLELAPHIGADLKHSLIDGGKFLAFDPGHVSQIAAKVSSAREGLQYLREAPNHFDSQAHTASRTAPS